MSGPRVENVKEALAWYDGGRDPVDHHHFPVIINAARAWLASQEQTPDYRAAKLAAMEMDEQIAMARFQGQRFSLTEVNDMKVKAAVDAAFVGFHPQPVSPEVPT